MNTIVGGIFCSHFGLLRYFIIYFHFILQAYFIRSCPCTCCCLSNNRYAYTVVLPLLCNAVSSFCLKIYNEAMKTLPALLLVILYNAVQWQIQVKKILLTLERAKGQIKSTGTGMFWSANAKAWINWTVNFNGPLFIVIL